jgi:hypothetical protein
MGAEELFCSFLGMPSRRAFLGKNHSERRLAILIEARRAERIIKLHWLRHQAISVRGFLAELNREVRVLKRELERIDD